MATAAREAPVCEWWFLDVRLTTYDGRDRLATMRHATVASRKVVMSLAHVVCRKSHVPSPRNAPSCQLKPLGNLATCKLFNLPTAQRPSSPRSFQVGKLASFLLAGWQSLLRCSNPQMLKCRNRLVLRVRASKTNRFPVAFPH